MPSETTKSCSLVSPTQRAQHILISGTWSFPLVCINFSTKRIDSPTVAGQITILTCKFFPTKLPTSALEKYFFCPSFTYFKHAQFHYAKALSLKALPFEFLSKKTNSIICNLLTCIQYNQRGFGREGAAVVTCRRRSRTALCSGSAMEKMDPLPTKTEPEEHTAPLQ